MIPLMQLQLHATSIHDLLENLIAYESEISHYLKLKRINCPWFNLLSDSELLRVMGGDLTSFIHKFIPGATKIILDSTSNTIMGIGNEFETISLIHSIKMTAMDILIPQLIIECKHTLQTQLDTSNKTICLQMRHV